jgi:hypothetical protein
MSLDKSNQTKETGDPDKLDAFLARLRQNVLSTDPNMPSLIPLCDQSLD